MCRIISFLFSLTHTLSPSLSLAELACNNQQHTGIAAAAEHLDTDSDCSGHPHGGGAQEVSANGQQVGHAHKAAREREQYHQQCSLAGGSWPRLACIEWQSYSQSSAGCQCRRCCCYRWRRHLEQPRRGRHTRRHWH